MIYPVANFKDKWYIALGFGSKQSYGFHEGVDINLKTGGDSDLGQPLMAIFQYNLSYYHLKSHLESGFGCHFVYKIVGPWGERWVHYAHNMIDPPVLNKPQGNEGEVVSFLGKTGRPRNELPAHLHMSIFKVNPSELPQGIDTIAKTTQQLNTWFEDPIGFIETWKSISSPTPPMSDERPYWFDLINKVVWNKPHEQLTLDMIKTFVKDYPSQYARSGEYDKIVHYIKNDTTIDTNSVSAQDLINTVGGLRGDAKRAREEAEVAKREIANRVEQISRLEARLLDTEKLLADASKSNLPYLDRIKILEGVVDTLSKEKGVLMLDLTKCQAGNETAKKNLIEKVVQFINSIWK